MSPTNSLPETLRVLPSLAPAHQENAGPVLPNIAELLAKLPARTPGPISERPPPQYLFLGHGLPPLPKSMADRILNGDYIDFADLPPAKGKIRPLSAPEGSVILVNAYKLMQQRRLIPDLATWLQCCALYMALVCSRNPGRLNDLIGYMAQIAKTSLRFRWPSWVIYDLNFRQEAASRGIPDWAHLDPSLFAQCFTGQAKQQEAWCKTCHSLDHSSDQCPLLPPQPKRPKPFTSNQPALPPRLSQEVCRRYNKENCSGDKCRYKHCCLKCSGAHPASRCPKKPTATSKPPASSPSD